MTRLPIALLLLALSCDRVPTNSSTITLRFWNGFTGPDGRTMLHIVRQFNAQSPDVQVVMQRMDWGTYYNKLFVAGLGHRSPDVFVIHTDSLRRFIGAGLVRPVDDLVGVDAIDVSDMDQNVWDAVAHAGRHYAVPLDIHPLGMYYNRKLFVDAGIVDEHGNPRPPTNRQEFLQAARKLTRDTSGDGRPEQWGYVFTWMRTNCYTLMRQNGGVMYSADESRCLLNSPENIAALKFARDLIREYRVAPGPENFDAWIGFRQGRVGIVFEGIYMLSELQQQTDLDFAAAPLPVLGETPAAWAGSHNLCLRTDLDGARLAAAQTFIKFLSDNSLDWAEGGQVPVRKSLRDSPRFAAMTAQREFARQIPYASYLPSVPFAGEAIVEFDIAIEQILRGSASPETALAAATEKIDRIIARYRESARQVEARR